MTMAPPGFRCGACLYGRGGRAGEAGSQLPTPARHCEYRAARPPLPATLRPSWRACHYPRTGDAHGAADAAADSIASRIASSNAFSASGLSMYWVITSPMIRSRVALSSP